MGGTNDDFCPINCCKERCGASHWHFAGIKVQPYWLETLELIKSGINADEIQRKGPFDENEVICMKCWLAYKVSGKRRKERKALGLDDPPEEVEFSPYYFHSSDEPPSPPPEVASDDWDSGDGDTYFENAMESILSGKRIFNGNLIDFF